MEVAVITGPAGLIGADADQIYGFSSRGISESFSFDGPRSFYGVNKLSSEQIIAEYASNYSVKTSVNRCRRQTPSMCESILQILNACKTISVGSRNTNYKRLLKMFTIGFKSINRN